MKVAFAIIILAALTATPAVSYDFHDTVFPEPDSDRGEWRIGDTSWVSLSVIHGCASGPKENEADGPLAIAGAIEAKEGLYDPRGYNLPSIGISCNGDPGAPLKYSVWLADNAWFKGAEATENTPIVVPDSIILNVDGRDIFTVYGKAEYANIFHGEISWNELLRIRKARQVIYETSQGSPGLAFPAIGTSRAVDTLLTACGITPTKDNLK